MADENTSQEALNEEIASQDWLRGKIEIIGSKTRTGLIKTEDGTLVKFAAAGWPHISYCSLLYTHYQGGRSS